MRGGQGDQELELSHNCCNRGAESLLLLESVVWMYFVVLCNRNSASSLMPCMGLSLGLRLLSDVSFCLVQALRLSTLSESV